MEVIYIGTAWGLEFPTIEATLEKVKEGGYDGVEMGVPANPAEAKRLRAVLDDLGLALVAQQWTQGLTPEEHARSFEEQYRRGAEFHPLLVNSHTGKDSWTTADNVVILRKAKELEDELGVPVAHEIHRGRMTYSTVAVMGLLDAMPTLQLTADFSHWCCVHESLLEDQQERVQRAIEHSLHIHARVGHPEGPQVTDPRAPEWRQAVEAHLEWWQKILQQRARAGAKTLTICPEFGPPGYMVVQPYTRQPIADLREVNLYMKDLLKERLRFPAE
ncbi:MAG: sugar phosphate isomerase/epimerase [Bacteroidetes bacterium]|jgi:sugar phosphate isomerase/epimerase|nr:sugar phosphate isomerase/epimerase [Bacteroidota bacterium]